MKVDEFSGTVEMFAEDTQVVPLEYAKQLEVALVNIFSNSNCRHEVEAQLGDVRPDWMLMPNVEVSGGTASAGLPGYAPDQDGERKWR